MDGTCLASCCLSECGGDRDGRARGLHSRPRLYADSDRSSRHDPAKPVGGTQPQRREAGVVPLAVAEGNNPGAASGQSLKLPQDWTAEVWANVPGARISAWDPNGSLLVSNGRGGAVTRLTPTEDGKAPKQEAMTTGLNNPQGLGFALNGEFLVVGEGDKIVIYEYASGHATNARTIVGNLPPPGTAPKASRSAAPWSTSA